MDETPFQKQYNLALQILIDARQTVTIDYVREKVKRLTGAPQLLPGVSRALRHDRRIYHHRRKGIDKYLWKGEPNEAVTRAKAKIAGDKIFREKSYDVW